MNQALSDPDAGDFVFVADNDNLSYLRDQHGSVDVPSLARLLKSRGVTSSIVISNWLSPFEAALWRAAGARCVETGVNCDDHVAQVIRDLARAGAKRILLGSGDHCFADLVTELRAQGVAVHVLAARDSLSARLRDAATNYAWIDRYVCVTPAASHFTSSNGSNPHQQDRRHAS